MNWGPRFWNMTFQSPPRRLETQVVYHRWEQNPGSCKSTALHLQIASSKEWLTVWFTFKEQGHKEYNPVTGSWNQEMYAVYTVLCCCRKWGRGGWLSTSVRLCGRLHGFSSLEACLNQSGSAELLCCERWSCVLGAEDLTCVLVGALAGLLEPVRKSLILCFWVLCAGVSREELDYWGVGGCRACAEPVQSQSVRAWLLCGVRDCSAVVQWGDTCHEGSVLDGCSIYIKECCVKRLFSGSGEWRTVWWIMLRDRFVVKGSKGLLCGLYGEMWGTSLRWN